MAPELIRDDDEVVYGDAGFLGLEKRDEEQKVILERATGFKPASRL